MSVSPNFLSKFFQAPPSPKVYTEQDIVDDFIQKIEETASNSKTSEVYVKYMFPDKFTTTFSKKGFWNIIQTVLVKQMNCSKTKNIITFAHEQQQMNYKEFYYVKTKVLRQYNEEYIHNEWCKYEDVPDGVIIKLYVSNGNTQN